MSAVGKHSPFTVFHDLNFYNVTSPTDLAYRLRTLQRVVAAGIGTYLFYRFHPLLTSQISLVTCELDLASVACFFTGYTLCTPAVLLASGGIRLYEGCVDVFSGVKHKDIESIVFGAFKLLIGYVSWSEYRRYSFCFYKSPDPVDKLFVRVANDYSGSLYRRFYW